MRQQLTDEIYARFRDLVQSRCGLYYPESKRGDLAHSLDRTMQACQIDRLSELYAAAAQGGPVWERLLEHLTIGETYFFRNMAQFDALRLHILPEIRARRDALRSVRIWSAGCATGEEPYSLAMLLGDLLPLDGSWSTMILATDINPHFLAQAQEGLYGEWSFRETSADQRARFFTPEGARWRLNAGVWRAVTFARLNLVEPVYPSISNGTCALDLIVCRNVTIYFDESTTRAIVDRFYRALAPGGWLIVGHAEPQASVYHQFEVQNFPDTIIYRKSLDAPLFAFDPSHGTFTSGDRPILTPRIAAAPARAAQQPTLAGTGHRKAAVAAPPSPPPALPAVDRAASLSIEQVWAEVVARQERGEKVAAEKLAAELLRRAPDHVAALTLLARMHADRASWAAARSYCEQVLARDPLAVEVHYLLGQIHEHQRQFEQALAAYRRTVYLDRDFVLGMLGMADVWRQMGLRVEAGRGYQRLIRHLATLAPHAPVAGPGSATARDLIALAQHRMRSVSIE